MSCDSVCSMCGQAWGSHWLMTQLTNGQHACVLVFVPMVDIFNIPCVCKFVFCALDELYVSDHAWCRVHYKSMKCDVSFSQGSVSTLCRWGEHFFMQCKNVLPAYSSAKLKKKSIEFFPELWPQIYCHVFYESQCISYDKIVRYIIIIVIIIVYFMTYFCAPISTIVSGVL